MDFTNRSVEIIIQQLNYSNYSLNNFDNLVNSLKQIVSTTQSNLVHRKTLGQTPQFWTVTTKLWVWTSENLLKDELSVIPVILELIRLFRNIVPEVLENQNQALEHKWNEITEKILWYSMSKFNSEADNKFISILRFGSQALSNVITGNVDAQELVWSDFMSRNESNDILSTLVKCEDYVVLTSILVLVYNCIHESEFRSKTLIESQSGIHLLKRLLERAEVLLEDESSQNFELIYALFSRLIELGVFPLFYDSLNQSSRQVPTCHQITLLKILDSKFFSSLKINNEFSISICICIVRNFNSICPQIIYSMQQAENNFTILSEDQIEDSRLLYTALVLLLQCIGKLSQERDSKIYEYLFEGGVIASSISLLFQADKTLPRMTLATTPITQTQTLQQVFSGFASIKKDIVKIIGNMAYENNVVQDEVRNLGGIPLILNQCNIDDNNPYIREHAIFAIRNLLINNSENQNLVEQLAPIETVQHPALQDAGIMTELGPDGKMKLSIDPSKNARK